MHIFVNDQLGSSWNRNVDVVADSTGEIYDQFNLPNWFVAEYQVVASGPDFWGREPTGFTRFAAGS